MDGFISYKDAQLASLIGENPVCWVLFAVHLITVTDRIKHLRLAGAFFIEKNKKVLANKIICQPEGEKK